MTDNQALNDSHQYFEAKSSAEDNDFSALDQGEAMTLIRHQFVLKYLHGHSRVLDYGCGTGLILTRPNFPKSVTVYDGADFVASREPKFLARVRDAKKAGQFHLVSSRPPYEQAIQVLMRDLDPDVVVLCGVMGYQGFTDLQSILTALRYNGPRTVIMTVPVVTPEYDETVIHRFDVSGLTNCLIERLHPGLVGVVCS